MIERQAIASRLDAALRRFPVVALVGPRQCGKTTLARTLLSPTSSNYFDLERPTDEARLKEPMLALEPLKGLVVLDEVQHAPEVFRVLRVLADERPLRRRILVLGSASPALLRQGSESLAGRIHVIEMSGFTGEECGAGKLDRRWFRGGLPRSFLARSDADAAMWLDQFIDTVTRRDIPALESRIPDAQAKRLLAMIAHYHGQTLNVAVIAAAIGLSAPTVRRYIDLLTDLFHVRQLRPWHENLAKRQVRSPKIYIRDSGMLHRLIGIPTADELLRNPRLGASWEGLVIEEIASRAPADEVHWWATHQGAELDLLLLRGGRRYGVEIKRSDAPGMTKSIEIARTDLGLERVTIVAPVPHAYDVADGVRVVPFADVVAEPTIVVGGERGRRRRPGANS